MGRKKSVEIHSTEKIDDNYMEAFKPGAMNMISMSDFLKDMEENSKWLKLSLEKMSTGVESGGPLLLDDIKSRYRFIEGTSDEAITSTIENGTQVGTIAGSQMLICTREINEKINYALLLSTTGLSSLIVRSGVDCSAIGKASITDKKTMIDIGLKNSSSKQVLALFSCGKIRTFNGGNTYAILKQSEMFDAIINLLNTQYGDFVFKGGYYSHSRTQAAFELTGDTNSILEAYKNACEEIGSIKNKGLKVQFLFSTSDIGDECATISVALVRGNLKILLGSPIQIPHNGDMTTENFKKELPLLLAKTKDLVSGLQNLINIEIKNPINCMISIAKNAGLLKTQTMAAIADFQNMMDAMLAKDKNAKFSAHDVFFVLQETLMEMRKASVASATIEKCEENISRTLVKEFDWSDYDVPVRPEWNQK